MHPHLNLFGKKPVISRLWYDSCDALARMRGLHELVIRLNFGFLRDHGRGALLRQWVDIQEELFAPVKAVTAPRSFVIVLPDQNCSTELDVGATNCVFQVPDAII